jgi:hypothetical protein
MLHNRCVTCSETRTFFYSFLIYTSGGGGKSYMPVGSANYVHQ